MLYLPDSVYLRYNGNFQDITAMAKFINPFTDVGFKRIFGQEINKDLLIDFLNALLEGERHVEDIHFLDKELLPEFENDRGLIYDVYCTDSNGEQFIVEMQNREHVNFRERTLYYLSQAIARQGRKGIGLEIQPEGCLWNILRELPFDRPSEQAAHRHRSCRP